MSIQSGKTDGSSGSKGYGPDDPELDARIKNLRKAELAFDEIMHDPNLEQARKEVAAMMAYYDEMKKKDSFKKSESFIRNSFSGNKEKGAGLPDEIRQEISNSNVGDLSAEWVREWHRKKQMEVSLSPADQERRDFVTSALSSDQETAVKESLPESPESPVMTVSHSAAKKNRPALIRFASLAAAAVLGTFLILRALAPSGNTEKLYDNYYTTFKAATPVVRGENLTIPNEYATAVNSYKKGDYTDAAERFLNALKENPSNMSAEFYLGLSSIETGNLDQAIASLTSASTEKGVFSKESKWYLGLAYLKKGDVANASECFNSLASEEGFYQARAERILRRLNK